MHELFCWITKWTFWERVLNPEGLGYDDFCHALTGFACYRWLKAIATVIALIIISKIAWKLAKKFFEL